MERNLFVAVSMAALYLAATPICSADIFVTDVGLHVDHNANIAASEGAIGSSIAVGDPLSTNPGNANNLATYNNLVTLTGLDLDGIGGNNDSFSFTINAAGAANDNSLLNNDGDANTGGLGVNGGSNTALDSPGESITFSAADIAVTADDPNISVVFAGFTGLLVSTDLGGNDYSVNGTNHSVVDLDLSATPVSGDMTVAYARAGTYRIRGVDVQFTVVSAVPEPNSASLVGLAVLGLVARRRRKQV